jgi:hypothetical protein
MRLYPNADPQRDFAVVAEGDGQKIEQWNVKDADGNPVPEPTDAELLAAWQEYQENPPPRPPSTEDRVTEQDARIADIELALAELFTA